MDTIRAYASARLESTFAARAAAGADVREQPSMIRVTIIAQGAEQEPELKEFMSGQISIGRLGRNDLVLVSSRVSSQHARAIEGEQGITLIDNNSTNGTFVNGTLVRGPVAVEPEDSVEIGSFTLHFERVYVEAGESEEMVEDDGSMSEIAPSEFDGFADEHGDFPEPDLLPLEHTPQDAFAPPEHLDPEPPIEATPVGLMSPLHAGTVPDERAPRPRTSVQHTTPNPVAHASAQAGRGRAEPPGGLAGAFERTVVALAPSPASERTEARALACARDAVELSCPDLDPRARRQWSEWIAQEAVGIGPLTDLLADPAVSEVLVLGAAAIEVRRDGARVHHPSRFSCERAVAVALDRLIGAAPNELHPSVEGVTSGNVSVHAVGRPLVHAGPIVVLSRPQAGPRSLADFVGQEQIGADAADALAAGVARGSNVLVCGPAGLDSSAWIAAIAGQVPTPHRVVAVHRGRIARNLGERAIAIDGARDMGAALRSGLRMRPDCLIVQELGGLEAVELCASSRRGGGSTIVSLVADSPEGALARLQAMVSLGVPRDPAALRGYVAGCFDLVLALRDSASGRVVAGSLAEIRHAHAGELVELFTHDD
jgi:pilus assembly protein CpaF